MKKQVTTIQNERNWTVTVTFQFDGLEAIELSVQLFDFQYISDELSEEQVVHAIGHGLSQKVGDKVPGKMSPMEEKQTVEKEIKELSQRETWNKTSRTSSTKTLVELRQEKEQFQQQLSMEGLLPSVEAYLKKELNKIDKAIAKKLT